MGHRYLKDQKEKRHGCGCLALFTSTLAAAHFPTPVPAFMSIGGLPPYDFVFHSRTMPWGNFPAEKGQLFRLPSALNR